MKNGNGNGNGNGNSNNGLYKLFLDELKDMYSSERQIVESLPGIIDLTTLPDLKEALTKNLKETKNQVNRIEKIFIALREEPEEKTCRAMQGLIQEARDIIKNKQRSSVLDAAIIFATQKIEHYEIATYGTLKSFAKTLELSNDVVKLIQETLDEEIVADKKLSKIAEGSFFTTGVNKEALTVGSQSTKHK